MNNRFSGNNSGFRKKNERERLFFVAAAGLAFSLLIITVVIFNFRTPAADATAGQNLSIESNIPASVGTTTILAAKRPVPEGTKLSDIELTEMYWPMHKVPAGAIRDRSELQNLFAARNIEAGSPITRTMTSKDQVSTSLPVTPGNRAVTIQVDAVSGLEGHIRPGSLVDVALTYNEGGELTTKAIVQKARVISYGGQVNPRTPFLEAGGPKLFNTATLDLTPNDAMTILTARKLGTLSLMMRAAEDNKILDNNEVREEAVSKPGQHGKGKSESNRTICGTAKVGDMDVVINCGPGGRITRLDNDM
ncbi:MAG: Flp pilus assembly protein CpaB [Deltaproteobacteria bacterium]|nr:Flp pilus assembly protein CpaB [Deltaproteobacteria bacterium]